MVGAESKYLKCDEVTSEDLQELVSYCDMGSLGMINMAARCLKTIRGRIVAGDRVKVRGVVFTTDDFDYLVRKEFPEHVIREVIKDKAVGNHVYFDLKNTAEGFDLVHTQNAQNKLVKWIANISEEYQLVCLRVNCVVYIRNRETGDLTPMVSEHNNYYVYDIENGKIKEVM